VVSLSGCTIQIHGGLARVGQAGAARFPYGSLRCGNARLGRRLGPSTYASSAAGRAAGGRGRPHCDVSGAELPHGLLIGPGMSPTSARESRCGDSPFQRPAGLTQPAPPLGPPPVRIPLSAAACRTSRRSPRSGVAGLACSSAGSAGIRPPSLQLKVVPSAADRVAGHSKQHQKKPNDEYPDKTHEKLMPRIMSNPEIK
jgi:hypothetical protein